jgi:tetratricopeptide (TPR) repeat protein
MNRGSRAPRPFATALLVSVLFMTLLTLALAPTASADGAGGTPRTPAKPDDPDYTKAVTSIKAGAFATAIPLLESVVARDGNNADAYNWLGYAVRRNGDPARSIPIYQKALAIDAKHRGAHEYIGEAYLALDDIGKAKEHLARLDGLCFLPCAEYRDLRKAVEAYEKSAGKVKPTAGK